MLHILTRFVQMIMILAVLSVALFGLLSAMPGNPVDMLITSNPRVKPEDVIRLKKLRGLDKPWYVQYVRWMWGYNDPHRPATVGNIPPVEVDFKNGVAHAQLDIAPYLMQSDFHFDEKELRKIVQSARPELDAKVMASDAVKKAKRGQRTDAILEEIAVLDPAFYKVVTGIYKKKAIESLSVEGLFGAKADGKKVAQDFFKPGEHYIWTIVKNAQGLQTVAAIPVTAKDTRRRSEAVAAPIQIEPISSKVVDDPKTFRVKLAKYVDASSKGALRYDLVNGSPGHIDDKGNYTNKFKKPGQTAISFSVTDSQGNKSLGAFSVEHGPIPDKSRFNRGFIFVFAGDKEALGFSSTYKRSVWELLAGPPSECGNRRVDPGEGCDDGNIIDGDGCVSSCQVEGAGFWATLDVKLAGLLVGSGRIGNTIALMLPAILLSLLIALPLGVISAYRQYSWLDYIVNFFAFIGISLPVFWFAIMVMFLFAEKFQWLPAGGIQTPGVSGASFFEVLGNRIEHAILPTVVLSIAYTGRWLRYMRSSMLEILPSDYIRTARAKGLGERVVILKHALRNALIPVVTVMALSIPALFGGAVLTETVFSWPGIGRLQYDAVMNSDYYVAIVVFLISAFMVMIGNLLADLLYVIVDPRIRHQ